MNRYNEVFSYIYRQQKGNQRSLTFCPREVFSIKTGESDKIGSEFCFPKLKKKQDRQYLSLEFFFCNEKLLWCLANYRELPRVIMPLYSSEESEAYSDVYEKDTLEQPTSLSKLLEILSNSHKSQLNGRYTKKKTPVMDCLTSFVKRCLPIFICCCTSHSSFLQSYWN